MPVETARRTVRSGRSPYTSWPLSLALRHSSVSRSSTAGDGSRATTAPLSAPTLVPRTRSGVMLALEQRPQHADLDRAEDAPAAEHERGRHGLASRRTRGRRSRVSARTRAVARCSAQKLSIGIGAADQRRRA